MANWHLFKWVFCVKPRSNEDASWCKLANKSLHGLAWLLGQTRTRVACESMRVERKLTRKTLRSFVEPFCWACCYKVETASRLKLVNNSHATLMTGQTSKNSRWLASKFETAQSWCELPRVDASWRSNASETCNSHQLASSFDRSTDRGLRPQLHDIPDYFTYRITLRTGLPRPIRYQNHPIYVLVTRYQIWYSNEINLRFSRFSLMLRGVYMH